MTLDPSETSTTQSNGSTALKDELGSVQMVGLAMALRDVGQHLAAIDAKLDAQRETASRRGGGFLEFWRIVFSGWPALGFLFIILFYFPLRDALNAIPDKVKTADEIGVLGVSLKSTIKKEAAKLGEVKLSETLPSLSNSAIELLLRAPRNGEGLVSYSPNDQHQPVKIHFPSPSVLTALSELQTQGLVDIETFGSPQDRNVTGPEITESINKFRAAYPGTEEPSFDDGRATWILNSPLSRETRIPEFSWKLSELGKKGVDVILKAVSTELAPKSQPERTSDR